MSAARRPKATPLTTVLIVAETPEHHSTQNPGQPSSTMKGYRVPALEGETIADVMTRVLNADPTRDDSLGQFGLGTTFYGYDEQAAIKLALSSQLQEVNGT